MTQAFNLAQLANNVNSSGLLSASTGLTGSTPVANGGTGLSTLTANNVILGNGTSAVQFVAPGASGNLLTSNGTTWQSTAVTLIPQIQTQTLTTGSSTWSKPTTGGYQFLKIQMWAGGGSGGRNTSAAGGAGGAYNEITIPLSYLASSESYTVGAGGAALTANGIGNVGGFSSFALTNYPGGAKTLYGYGGGGGGSLTGGGGGGLYSAGGNGATSAAGGNGGTSPALGGAGGAFSSSGGGNGTPGDSVFGGGGGGGSTTVTGTTTAYKGGDSYFGGGGGGAGTGSGSSQPGGVTTFGGGGGGATGSTASVGGISVFGGSGSSGNNTAAAAAGATPAGGGGGSKVTSGAGGAGQIILTWW